MPNFWDAACTGRQDVVVLFGLLLLDVDYVLLPIRFGNVLRRIHRRYAFQSELARDFSHPIRALLRPACHRIQSRFGQE